MLYRALLVLTYFPLTACTTVVSETPQLADLAKAIVSYAHVLADAREDLTGTNSKARPKKLSREFTAWVTSRLGLSWFVRRSGGYTSSWPTQSMRGRSEPRCARPASSGMSQRAC